MGSMTKAPGRQVRGRWRATTLAAWLGIPGLAAAAAPKEGAAVESRFEQGRQRFSEQRYLEAAEAFTEVLGQVDEVILNRVTRENVMLNVLLAYEWAYRTSTDDEGDKDVGLLDEGQRVLDGYRAELSAAYGKDADPSPELAEAIARYEEARRIAHEKHGSDPGEQDAVPEEPDPPVGPCLSPPPPPPAAQAKGCGGGGDDASVAWLGLLALPLVRRRRRAVEHFADRLPADVMRRLRQSADED